MPPLYELENRAQVALKLKGQPIEMFPLESRFIKCDCLGQMIGDEIDSLNLSLFVEDQWSRQKSGGDSAVSSELRIAGMIFHPSRVQS